MESMYSVCRLHLSSQPPGYLPTSYVGWWQLFLKYLGVQARLCKHIKKEDGSCPEELLVWHKIQLLWLLYICTVLQTVSLLLAQASSPFCYSYWHCCRYEQGKNTKHVSICLFSVNILQDTTTSLYFPYIPASRKTAGQQCSLLSSILFQCVFVHCCFLYLLNLYLKPLRICNFKLSKTLFAVVPPKQNHISPT